MEQITFGGMPGSTDTAILIKSTACTRLYLDQYYVTPLESLGITRDKVTIIPLSYAGKKKVNAPHKKEFLAYILPHLDAQQTTTLYVADAEYFKTLTGKGTTEPHHGYTLPCVIKGYEHMIIVLGINYQAMAYNDDLKAKLDVSLHTLAQYLKGKYVEPGSSIIKFAEYPKTVDEISTWLNKLHQYPKLTCDIEAFSLKFYTAGIATISFAWNQHEGIAFPVDLQVSAHDAKEVRRLLLKFFLNYHGSVIYHNIGYDAKVLIYQLFMKNLMDYKGMLHGLDIMTRRWDDTKLITYLATNRCGQQSFKLKDLAQEFSGNWAQSDIHDVTLIPLDQLLQYNLVDCLSTWYVYNKYTPIMLDEDQMDIYQDLFKPSAKVLLQTELVGMPIDPVKVQEAKVLLQDTVHDHTAVILGSKETQAFHYLQKCQWAERDNEKLKTKKRYPEDFDHIDFNPGSGNQLQGFIYSFLGYPVIDTTDTGAPATGSKTLEKLVNHAKTQEHKELFEHMIGLVKADKILTSFIPAFEAAVQLPDGSWRLYGNFNLGGTQSGRLSSSGPNMQNLPSGSKYGELIKACFISPPGWIFGGADFNALEARVGALLPQDPAKLKVYTDGYDSHCLNAFAYFGDQMPGIIDTVASVNSIEKMFPALRQKSKAPTFA